MLQNPAKSIVGEMKYVNSLDSNIAYYRAKNREILDIFGLIVQ